VTKVEAKRAEQDEEILASCEAGISAVLSNPLVQAAEQLFDEICAELFSPVATGDPLAHVRSQLLRSAGSVVANIAEGHGKAGADVRRFYLIARGSAYESVIWLRALGKTYQLVRAIELCNEIDVAIIRLTRPLQSVPQNDGTPGRQSAAVSTELDDQGDGPAGEADPPT
jgi:four helix bundle protein